MGWFSDDSQQAQAYDQVQTDNNYHQQDDPSKVQELLAGAGSYEAMKMYENHEAENGDPGSHDKAKEIAAGFAGAFVDRQFQERRFDDRVDQDQARQQAQQQVYDAYDQQNGLGNYGGGGGGDGGNY